MSDKNFPGMASKTGGKRRVVCSKCKKKVKLSQTVLMTESGKIGGHLLVCERCRAFGTP